MKERNCLGSASAKTGSGVKILVHTNGIFSLEQGSDNFNINTIKELVLDGGKFLLPDKGHNIGVFVVTHRASFAGPEAYSFASNGANRITQRWLIGADYTNTEFHVEDITGKANGAVEPDDLPDVTFALPVAVASTWTNVYGEVRSSIASRYGFKKTGPGKMVLASPCTDDSSSVTPNGSIDVQEGTLAITCANAFNPYSEGTLRVNTNATLEVCEDAFTSSSTLNTNVFRSFDIDHGKVVFDSRGNRSHMAFGDLTLDNAVLDWSNWLPDGTYGSCSLHGKVTVLGTMPVAFDVPTGVATNSKYARLSLSAIPSRTEFDIADVTGDDRPDCTIHQMLFYQRSASQAIWIEKVGFVKSGAGTLTLANKYNDFTGDIDVHEGILSVGPNIQENASGNRYLGPWTDAQRTLTVHAGGTLFLPNRNVFGTQSDITNDTPLGTFVFDGGTLTNSYNQGFMLPDLTFKNGGRIAPGQGAGGYGRFRMREKFTVTGSTPFVWEPTPAAYSSASTMSQEALSLNGYPENVFVIDDVTGDSAADATFGVPFIIAWGFFRNDVAPRGAHLLSDWAFGFTKTGAGTMRITAPSLLIKASTSSANAGLTCRTFNGDAKVAAGTLQIDGDIALSDTVRVESGAYLAGTGRVNNVSIADGGGLRVQSGQSNTLKVTGDLSLGTGLSIAVDMPVGFDVRQLRVAALEVSGTVTGAQNLSSATVTANGAPLPMAMARLSGNILSVAHWRGTTLLFK